MALQGSAQFQDSFLESMSTDTNVLQYWSHCRWMNPMDPGDVHLISEKLSRAKRSHPELLHCTLDSLRHVLACVRTPSAVSSDGDSGSARIVEQANWPSIQLDRANDSIPQALPSIAQVSRLPLTSGPDLPPPDVQPGTPAPVRAGSGCSAEVGDSD